MRSFEDAIREARERQVGIDAKAAADEAERQEKLALLDQAW
jgi:hypothetical protein